MDTADTDMQRSDTTTTTTTTSAMVEDSGTTAVKDTTSVPSPVSTTDEEVRLIVIDTGALIKGARLERLGSVFYTVEEVVKETRDKRARQFLENCPYEIKIKDPTTEALRTVGDFARKTGDFASLSLVDLKVLALTYDLTKEARKGDTTNILSQPAELKTSRRRRRKRNVKEKTVHETFEEESTEEIAEEQEKEEKAAEVQERENTAEEPAQEEETSNLQDRSSNTAKQEVSPSSKKKEVIDTVQSSVSEGVITEKKETIDEADHPFQQTENKVGEPESMEHSQTTRVQIQPTQEMDDESGWITPNNIKVVSASVGAQIARSVPRVGCVTTDFAMQSVLLQMGLNLISVEGMVIKKLKQWVKRCITCNKETREMEKLFCPACGNSTLYRVPVIIKGSGAVTYLGVPKVTTRGSKYHIAPPKGGKNGKTLILAEDQYIKKLQDARRYGKATSGTGVLDLEAPFAMQAKQTKVVVGHGNKNPNQARRKVGKKNKSFL